MQNTLCRSLFFTTLFPELLCDYTYVVRIVTEESIYDALLHPILSALSKMVVGIDPVDFHRDQRARACVAYI